MENNNIPNNNIENNNMPNSNMPNNTENNPAPDANTKIPANTSHITQDQTSKNNSNSWIMGFMAFILAVISPCMPYVLLLFLDIAVLILAIIALAKNYRLKGFAITAIVIAAICMGIGTMNAAMSLAFGDDWASKLNSNSSTVSSGSSSQSSKTNNSSSNSKSEKVVVTVTDKENFSEDYSAGRFLPYCQFTIKVSNYTGRNIKGVEGILTIKDLFGKEIKKVGCDLTGTSIPAGTVTTFKRGIEINDLFDIDAKLYNEKYEDLQFEYKVTDVVYE
ncbi:MAG: hypothetical protein J6M66_01265 [Lachnospiraceae bacterium]|nr:hypothetical protein [Lachnospiraceae bacterium]